MQRYPLGPFSVSRIGFGAMQLPGPGVFGPPRDRGEALAVLRHAVEAGVDHIDTAQYYGPGVANELIREALYPYPGPRRVRQDELRTAFGDGWNIASITADMFAINPGPGAPAAQAWLATIHRL